MEKLSLLKSNLDEYNVSAEKAVSIGLVFSKDQLDSKTVNLFHPEFSHQHFGDNESIFGYKNPEIMLLYTASSLKFYLSFKYEKRIEDIDKTLKADDVPKAIYSLLPEGVQSTSDLALFSQWVDTDVEFCPHGSVLYTFSAKGKTFEIRLINISPETKEFLERMQSFSYWFIDAASYSDFDDDRWIFFAMFEKYQTDEGKTRFVFAGYSSVYRYYAYPNHQRPRVAQLLILPPYRKMGNGVTFLQTIYNHFTPMSDVVDIAVEDPSDNYVLLRDHLDSINCSKLTSFQKDNLKEGFSSDMLVEAEAKLKIPKKQCRKIYEILRLMVTDTGNPDEWKRYRLDVKKRLNLPYQKEQRDWEKLQKALSPDELKTVAGCMRKEERLANLDQMFEKDVQHYRNIINKVKTYPEAPEIRLASHPTSNGIVANGKC